MDRSNHVTLPRRTLLMGAGTSALVLPAWLTRASSRAATPAQTKGPFYPSPGLLRAVDADLVRVTGADAQAFGKGYCCYRSGARCPRAPLAGPPRRDLAVRRAWPLSR